MRIQFQRRLRNAFTIVEVLVAMAILMFIVLAIYSSWSSILRAAKAGNDAAADAQRSRMTLRCIEEAFTTTQMFSENVYHYAFISESDDFDGVSMVSRLSPTFPGSGQFGEQHVRRISFTVEKGDDGPQLVMRQVPILMLTNDANAIYELVIAKHVESFLLEYWEPRIQDYTREWVYTNQIPRMVRVTLETGGQAKDGRNIPVSLVSTTVSVAGTNIVSNFQMGMPVGVPPGTGSPQPGSGNPPPEPQ